MKTLAEMNAAPSRREWDKYTLEVRYAVGRNGQQRSFKGATGTRLHLLRVEVVVEDREPKAGTYGLGARFAVGGICASNGQHTGLVVAGKDTGDVTCSRCQKMLGV